MAEEKEILVIAKRQRTDGSGGWVKYESVVQPTPVIADWGDYQPVSLGFKDTTQQTTAAVQVSVSNSANLAAARTAAENIARGLARIESELEAMNPNTVISWDGNSMTAGQILKVVNTTRWVVTDNPTFNNGGVGSANGKTDTVTLYYGPYDGVGPNDYAHPNFQNDAGLVGILLHDIGHMTPAGEAFFAESYDTFSKEYGTTNGFYSSTNTVRFQYAKNNEMFANDFAYAVGTAFGADTLQGVQLTHGTGAIDPADIYNTHMGF
jgi:hypothetical protein